MKLKIRQAFPCRILFTNLRLYIQPHYVIVHNISAAYIRPHAFGDVKAPLFIDGNGRIVMLVYGEINIFAACFLRRLFYPAEHGASQPQAAESVIHIQFAQNQRFSLKRHRVIARAHAVIEHERKLVIFAYFTHYYFRGEEFVHHIINLPFSRYGRKMLQTYARCKRL